MIRIKLIGIVAVSFAILSVLVFGDVNQRVENAAERDLESQLNRARKAVVVRRALIDHAILERAEQVAQTPKIAALLAAKPVPVATDEGTAEQAQVPSPEDFAYKIHQDVYEEVLVWDARLKASDSRKIVPGSVGHFISGPPQFLAVFGANGQGVAESQDAARYGKTANYGQNYPAVLEVLKTGKSLKDIWLMRGNSIAVSIVPVRSADGTVLGGVVLGYNLAAAAANEDKRYADAEVAYHVGGRTAGTSSLGARVEPAFQKAMASNLSESKSDRGFFELKAAQDTYKVSWVRLDDYFTKGSVLAVLVDRSAVMRSVKDGLFFIPAILVLFALLIGVGILVVFSRYDAQFRSLDKGVLEIINGGLDYWFEVDGSGVPSTMAQNLNIMVCQLSGRPLPEEDGAVNTEYWTGDKLFVESMDAAQHADRKSVNTSIIDTGQMEKMSKEMVSLIRDDDEVYHKNVYKQYVDALRATGQPADNVPYEGFVEQLTAHANRLKAELDCDRVRFLVEIEGGKSTLKPVPLD